MKKKFLFVLLFGGLLAACLLRDKRLDLPVDELIGKVIEGDKAFLANLNFAALDSRRLIRKRPGAAYYLACRLQDLGMNDEARILFMESFRHDTEPWKREAGLKLADGKDLNAESLAFLNIFRSWYPGDETVRGFYLKALFSTGRDEALLRELSYLPSRSPEELLLQAKAEKRFGSVSWPDTLRVLFYDSPSGDIHVKAWDFLESDPEAAASFPRRERAFFKAKRNFALGDAASAVYGFRLSGIDILSRPAVIWDYGSILLKAGRPREGIRELETLLPFLTTRSLIVAEDALGRLYRSAGDSAAGRRCYLRALETASLLEPKDLPVFSGVAVTDKTLWHLFDSSVNDSFGPDEKALLLETLPKIKDPSYFSDFFERLASLLVRERAWRSIEDLHTAMKGRILPEDSAHYAFLLAAALHSGLYRLHDSSQSQRSLLEETSAAGSPYYRILASLALGETMPVFDNYSKSAGLFKYVSNSPQDRFVQGFLDFGLPERGLDSAKALLDSLSPETLAKLARSEGEKGKYLDSLRLLHIAVRRDNAHPSRSTLETLYPLAYPEEMKEVFSLVSVPEPLFYGLIREESYFDANIRSHAGAVGLSQLMPSTARELARRIGMEEPVLTDPKVNLLLGSKYLKNLLDNFGSGVYGLAGYNAGGGRVIQWRRAFRGLPEVLFTEALPFEETRTYLRKVVVSAVFYGHLYHTMRPRETLALVYRDFF